jgi:hypothetical protein
LKLSKKYGGLGGMEKNEEKGKMDEITGTVERPDSIKVSRNAKGQHAIEQKRYFNSDEIPAEHVIDAMKATEDKFVETFKDGTD